jgi:YVTN family beta-propeller protein
MAPAIRQALLLLIGMLLAASSGASEIRRIDDRPIADLTIPGYADFLVADGDSVWVKSDAKGILTRIDPESNRIAARIPVPPNSYCAAYAFGSVWITTTGRLPSQQGSVQRIDPKTNRVIATIETGPQPRFLAAGEGGVWTLNQGDGSVTRVDPRKNKVAATIALGVGGSGG